MECDTEENKFAYGGAAVGIFNSRTARMEESFGRDGDQDADSGALCDKGLIPLLLWWGWWHVCFVLSQFFFFLQSDGFASVR